MRIVVSFLTIAIVVHSSTPALAQGQRPATPGTFEVERVAPPPVAPSQIQPTGGVSFASLFTDLGHDLARLPSKANALTLGIGAAASWAIYPADRELTRHATLSLPLDYAFEAGESAGSGWVQAGGALGTFLVGKATGNRRAQIIGSDLVRAQMINSITTEGVKLIVDRSRPDGGRFSFPSGHTSATFASATVLYRHLGWRVGLPAYGVAAYVGASRLQENRHYASDVIFGAALGIVAGRTVTLGRGSARFVAVPSVVPGGAAVMFTRVE